MLQGEHSAILSTFIKLPFALRTFVLTIFEWQLKTGFTVLVELGLTSYWNQYPSQHTVSGHICPLVKRHFPRGQMDDPLLEAYGDG